MRLICIVVWLIMLGYCPQVHAAANQGPSFDCRKAESLPEKTICADPTLRHLDLAVAKKYRALISMTATSGRTALVQAQREWLSRRDRCAEQSAVKECMAAQMKNRDTDLAKGISSSSLIPLIDLIEENPARAASVWGEVKDSVSEAWYAYFLRFGPAHDVKTANRILKNLLQDSANEDDRTISSVDTDDKFLYALRVVTEEDAMPWPCSVMRARGLPAWHAVAPRFGSVRDTEYQGPDCSAQGALLTTDGWKRVIRLLQPLTDRVWAYDGTQRYAKAVQADLNVKLSAVEPRLMMKSGQTLQRVLAGVQIWSNPRWVSPAWQQQLQERIHDAVKAWGPELSIRYQTGEVEAGRIAEAVAAVGLADLIGDMGDQVDLKNDTRLPEWMRGRWTVGTDLQSSSFKDDWKKFFDGAREISIEFDRICWSGKCEGYEVDVDESSGSVACDRCAALPGQLKKYLNGTNQAKVPSVSLMSDEIQNRGSTEAYLLGQGRLLLRDTANDRFMILTR